MYRKQYLKDSRVPTASKIGWSFWDASRIFIHDSVDLLLKCRTILSTIFPFCIDTRWKICQYNLFNVRHGASLIICFAQKCLRKVTITVPLYPGNRNMRVHGVFVNQIIGMGSSHLISQLCYMTLDLSLFHNLRVPK